MRFVLILLSFVHLSVFSADAKIDLPTVLVTPANNESTERLMAALEQHGVVFSRIMTLSEFKKNVQDVDSEALYIAVGPKVLAGLHEAVNHSAIVSIFTSSISYRQIVPSPDETRGKRSAIYADPSIVHQFDLIRALYPKNRRLGFIYSDKSKFVADVVDDVAKLYGYKLLKHQLAQDEHIAAAMNKMADVDVLLTIPDDKVYNKNTFRYFILTAYRRHQPIIGYSESFVKSGALGSSYSNMDHVIRELKVVIADYQRNRQLPEAYHAEHYRIVINNTVANALDIPVREADFPTEDVRFLEGSYVVSQ